MWGQVTKTAPQGTFVRIIPTRVGTSPRFCAPVFFFKDHPHACGDKSNASCNKSQFPGSSPRVWGQVATENFIKYRVRIIPTRVGTSQKSDFKVSPIQDHPHACGDKGTYPRGLFYCLGSSPRVWGQVQLPFSSYVGLRIIPTRVGTSTGIMRVWYKAEDHPHACGDKTAATVCLLCGKGSSPRVWGQGILISTLYL